MIADELTVLLLTAASIGLLHTLFGPDHYVPFVALARARRWSGRKALAVTGVCGVGHVLGSVVLGLVGVALGFGISSLEAVESVRGELAAWLLITLGLVYFVWGVRSAGRRAEDRPADEGHGHAHADAVESSAPWVLFLVFVLGPCEPLIPLLIYPAATLGAAEVVAVTAVFGIVTLATMVGAVALAIAGVDLLPSGRLQRYGHALAGATILLCGLGIQLLGL